MYRYEEQKKHIFTDEGQRLFLTIRDKAKDLLRLAGAVRCGNLIDSVAGDSWHKLACVDRMVELGELREVTKPDDRWAGQDRVFISGR